MQKCKRTSVQNNYLLHTINYLLHSQFIMCQIYDDVIMRNADGSRIIWGECVSNPHSIIRFYIRAFIWRVNQFQGD